MRYCVLIAISVLSLVVPTASAQPVTGGAKAGVVFANIPNLGDAAEASSNVRTGVTAGGFVTFGRTNGFAVQPEVLVTQKGAVIDESGFEVRIELLYLELPVLARYGFGAGTTRGYVFGGPSFNFKLDAVSKMSFEGEDDEEDIDDDVESFEFALVAGAGVEFGRFLVEGRYSEGLTNLVKDDELDEKLKNRTFAILAGIRF